MKFATFVANKQTYTAHKSFQRQITLNRQTFEKSPSTESRSYVFKSFKNKL